MTDEHRETLRRLRQLFTRLSPDDWFISPELPNRDVAEALAALEADRARWEFEAGKAAGERDLARAQSRCTNCGHHAPHTGPAGDIADACTHPGCRCGFDSRTHPQTPETARLSVTELRGGEENDGPLESTDLWLDARGVSLLVNVPGGSRAFYSFSMDGQHLQSGEVAVAAPASSEYRFATLRDVDAGTYTIGNEVGHRAFAPPDLNALCATCQHPARNHIIGRCRKRHCGCGAFRGTA